MEKSFFASIFDLSFQTFIVPKLLKFIFILAIIGGGIFALVVLISGFATGEVGGILGGLVGAPLIFFLYVIAARAYVELIMLQFNINKNVAIITEHLTGSSANVADEAMALPNVGGFGGQGGQGGGGNWGGGGGAPPQGGGGNWGGGGGAAPQSGGQPQGGGGNWGGQPQGGQPQGGSQPQSGGSSWGGQPQGGSEPQGGGWSSNNDGDKPQGGGWT